MQAVILVGGEGTRLRPLTYGTPKPMVPLFGVPFLERTMVRLREAGVSEVILAAGYLPQAIADYFGDGSRLGLKITYVVEESPLGTAGALRNVAAHIDGPFFMLNGDVLTSLDLSAMAAFHAAHKGIGVLHAIRVDDPSAFGCIVRDSSGRITAFVEKPTRDQAPSDEINAGTYLLERRVLDAIPAGRSVSIERETFPQLLAAGESLHSYVTGDYWLDVGRPEQYLQAHFDVLDGKLALGGSGTRFDGGGTMWRAGAQSSPPNVRVPVFIGERVALEASARIGPYAVIGNGCRIGAGAVVESSVLWNDVEVQDGAIVSGAILATDVVVGAGAVLKAGAVVGHGAQIAPATLVEAGARIGGASAPLSVPT